MECSKNRNILVKFFVKTTEKPRGWTLVWIQPLYPVISSCLNQGAVMNFLPFCT